MERYGRFRDQLQYYPIAQDLNHAIEMLYGNFGDSSNNRGQQDCDTPMNSGLVELKARIIKFDIISNYFSDQRVQEHFECFCI